MTRAREDQDGVPPPTAADRRPVVLVNVWHDDNAGDSAIAGACVELARAAWPDAPLRVHTLLGTDDPAYPGWDATLRSRFPDVTFHAALFPEPVSRGRGRRRSVLRRALQALPLAAGGRWLGSREPYREIAQARAVVLVGGSNLFAIRRQPTALLRLLRLLEPAVAARRAGVPVHLWGHTLGPFETRLGRRAFRRALVGTEQVVTRDAASAELARHALADAGRRADRVVQAPDLAFLTEAEPGAGTIPAGRLLALVPRTHLFDRDGRRSARLTRELAALARALLTDGEVDHVVVVPQVVGPARVEDDRRICAELLAAIDHPAASVWDGPNSPHRLMDLYGAAEGVVSVRLHGAILALAAQTPALAISYFTGKTEGVMGSLDMSGAWCEFDDFTAELGARWWRRRAEAFPPAERAARIGLAREAILDVVGAAGGGLPSSADRPDDTADEEDSMTELLDEATERP